MRAMMSFLILLGVLFGGANAQTWTPDAVVRRGIEQSPRVRSRADRVAAREGALRQAGAIANPTVGGTTGNLTQMLSVGQAIEYPAKRRVRVRRAGAELEAARWRLAQAEHEVAGEALTSLYRVMDADREAELFEKNLSVAGQLLAAAQERFDEGFGSRLDVIKGRVEVARARRLLLNAKKARATRRGALKLALGMAPTDTLVLADALDIALFPGPVNLDSLLEKAREHPRMRIQRYQVRGSRLGVQAARLATRPDFDVDLAGGVDDGESRVELDLRLPLPLWDRKAGRRSEAAALNRSAAFDSANVWLEVHRRVAASFYEYRGARQTTRLFPQSLLDEAGAAVDMAQQAFQSGQYRFLDLIDARRTYLETAQELLEAQTSLRLAEVEVLQAAGTPYPGEKR